MQNQNQFNDENLIKMLRSDCLHQAKHAATKLTEVVECLGNENHLGALGSFIGLDAEIVCLKVFLTRIAKLSASTEKELDT